MQLRLIVNYCRTILIKAAIKDLEKWRTMSNRQLNEKLVHCLTVDVEGFAEGMAESFAIREEYFNDAETDREIEINVNETLAGLERLGAKATFFVLGRVAERLPKLMRLITDNGHELGSHSFWHKRIFNQSQSEFRADLRRSKDVLENSGGCRVNGFRAPDFSIRTDSLWILDEIREAGFEYDSSLTPTDIHDVYGMPDVPEGIHRHRNGLWEFPGATFKAFGRTIPYGGGGYLRLYPIALSRALIRRSEKAGIPAMLYSHPYELASQRPQVRPISFYRRFRHYYHCQGGLNRLARVLDGFKVDTASAVLKQHGMGRE